MARGKNHHSEVQRLAKEFAGRISDLVVAHVEAEVDAKLADVLNRITGVGGGAFDRPLKIARVAAGRVVVACPVPGCKEAGVRPKRNFCVRHASELTAAQKTKYRQAQIAGRSGS
jgi:hypothetical protein